MNYLTLGKSNATSLLGGLQFALQKGGVAGSWPETRHRSSSRQSSCKEKNKIDDDVPLHLCSPSPI